jgi:hypothetical protein
MKIKSKEEELKELSNLDVLIDNEVVELYKMFTQSQELFRNYNFNQKGLFLKTVLVELNFSNKKELSIANTQLFSLLKDLNSYLWQGFKYEKPNFLPLFQYIKSNVKEIRELQKALNEKS